MTDLTELEGTSLPTDLDLHSPQFACEYESMVSAIVETSPVTWSTAHGGYWIVSGFDAATEVLSDHRRFSNFHDETGEINGYKGVGMPPAPIQTGFLEMDPPEHQSRRRLLAPMLTRGAVRAREAEIADLCTTFIDRVIETGKCDFVGEIASPVTAVITMRLLGIPDDEWQLYATAAHHWISSKPGSPEYLSGIEEYAEVRQSLERHLDARLASDERRDDVIDQMRDFRAEGQPMEPAEMMLHLSLVYMAGVDTTTNFLANTAHWLDQNPQVREHLATDPALISTAMNEFLRMQSPVPGSARTVTTDTEVAGTPMKAGDRLYVLTGAANVDPKRFECPADFDMNRTRNSPLTFGAGIHRCVGAPLAEVIFKIVMSETLKRMPDYKVVPGGARPYPSFGVIRGMVSLDLTFTPGSRVSSAVA